MSDEVLQAEDLDRLGQAVLTLTKELWVLRDRQRIMEAALAEAGVLAADLLDTYEPSAELKTALREERRQLIATVLDTLATPSA